MYTCTDQTARTIVLPVFPPRRIVSLVPSQTELLHALGLADEVVGITKFCVHPAAWFQEKKRVGGTKTVNPEKVAALAPDLIIANKEENKRVQIEALATRFPVWTSDVRDLHSALDMIGRVGAVTGRAPAAQMLVRTVEQAFADHRPEPAAGRPRAAYFIWRKPCMVAGGDTFIHAMLQEAGFENVFAAESRYPEILPEILTERAPDVLLLSSEPYPFAEKHVAEFQEICPAAQVVVVDGEMFSWYGSRLLLAPAYFRQLREKVCLAVFSKDYRERTERRCPQTVYFAGNFNQKLFTCFLNHD
ncbi:MAG: ABC transporter substrate-binding protein [Lewinellaceae bacterium]|nr:ABC transporter substrate-binding protein [Lewinellaceae bacterium]